MGRRLAIFLAACLAVPALAFAAEGDPKKRIVAADQKKAAAIVLKRADLAAGWKRVRTPDSGADPTCPGFDPDESDLTVSGESETEFEHPGGMPYVASSSSVFVSTRDALASWNRNVKPALARCIGFVFRQGIVEDGGKASIVKQGRISFPRFGQRTAAFRVAARVTITNAGKQVTVPVTIHVVGVGRGRADATLFAMGLGAGIPAAELRAFAKLLAGRLQTAGF